MKTQERRLTETQVTKDEEDGEENNKVDEGLQHVMKNYPPTWRPEKRLHPYKVMQRNQLSESITGKGTTACLC
jgi:hypothetical protein